MVVFACVVVVVIFAFVVFVVVGGCFAALFLSLMLLYNKAAAFVLLAKYTLYRHV